MRGAALVLAIVLLGGAWWWFGGRTADEPAVRYLTATVDRGAITQVITATGTINPVNSVDVGTYVSGPIQAIDVDFNSPIRRGQRMAKIDPRPFAMKLDAATAALAQARAQVGRARAAATLKDTTLRRLRTLRQRGIVSQSELDVAESDARQAHADVALGVAEIQAAEARQREAEVNLAYTDILAPVDGVVVARNVSPGQTVAAQFQTPVLFVVAEDLTKMQVEANVSESDIGAVAAGQPVSFTVDAYAGATFRGVVAQVRNAPVTIQNVVTYDVIVAVDNTDLRLKPGMTANVNVVIAARDDVVRVPSSALRFRPPGVTSSGKPTGPRVWRLGADGSPAPVEVTTGIADERATEIASGLEAGAVVITGIDHPGGGPVGSRGPSFSPGSARRAH